MPRVVALCLLVLLCSGFEWEGRLERLRRDLQTQDAARRREVVRLLGSYSADEVRDALIDALSDPDPGVRAEAATTVGRVRLREAVPRLLEWLNDSEADVRASACRALGQIGEQRSVPQLVRALGDAKAEVRRAAVEALAAIATPEVVVPLLGRLDDSDVDVRVAAAEALGQLDDERAVVPLVGRARDEAAPVRVAVYEALGALKDERAVPALLQAIHDQPVEARLAAIAALGRLGAQSAVELLIPLVDEGDARTARATVAALGAIGSEEATAAVIDALGERQTRDTAAEVLVAKERRGRAIGDAPAGASLVQQLATALEQTDGAVKATALADVLEGLARHRPIDEAAPALLRALRAELGAPPQMMMALAATGTPRALVPLLERLESDEAASQAAALDAIERYFDRNAPDGRAADPLLAVLGKVAPAQRTQVVRLLGRVRAPRALPVLRPLVEHSHPELRLAAVQALGAIGDPEAAPALLELLDAREPQMRFEAARALSAAATVQTVRALVQRLRGGDPIDRHAIVLALGGAMQRLRDSGKLPDEVADDSRRALLTGARGPDAELAARCIDALVRWGAPEPVPALVALVRRARAPLRRQLAFALGSFDAPRARAELHRLVGEGSDPSVRAAAAAALGEHGGEDEVELLLEAAEHAPWPVPAAASFALARLARRHDLEPGPLAPRLCRLAASRDPYQRANAAIALAALQAPPCPDAGAAPAQWLGPRHAAVVRGAAVRWIAAAARAGHIPSDRAQQVLERCIENDLAPEVVDACRDPALRPLEDEADVYAYASDGRQMLTDHLVALRLADGTVLLARTDLNGHLRLKEAPRGGLIVDDPVGTPLEP